MITSEQDIRALVVGILPCSLIVWLIAWSMRFLPPDRILMKSRFRRLMAAVIMLALAADLGLQGFLYRFLTGKRDIRHDYVFWGSFYGECIVAGLIAYGSYSIRRTKGLYEEKYH